MPTQIELSPKSVEFTQSKEYMEWWPYRHNPKVFFPSDHASETVQLELKERDASWTKKDHKTEKKRIKAELEKLKDSQKVVKKSLDSMSPAEYTRYRKDEFNKECIDMYPSPDALCDDFSTYQDIIKIANELENDSVPTACTGTDANTTSMLAGQVTSVRKSSSKLYFFEIEKAMEKIQLVVNQSKYNDIAEFKKVCPTIRRGDHVAVSGVPYKSRSGEPSLLVDDLIITAPCLLPLPKVVEIDGVKTVALSNQEERYRKRYLDMKINYDSRIKGVLIRDKVEHELTSFLREHGMVSATTPTLNPKASGASAKPFETYCNAIGCKVQMRIAPELYLKRLLVGGIPGVYELGRQYRNEDADQTHSPCFTTCESYMPYATYITWMFMTEAYMSRTSMKIHGSEVHDYQYNGKTYQIDWTPPYRRICIMTELPKELHAKGVEFEWPECMEDASAKTYLLKKCAEINLEVPEPQTMPRILDKMIGELLEPKCQNPTFLCNHPLVMSPLAKKHPSIPQASARFELFVMFNELCNAFTEQNDPDVQLAQFQRQSESRKGGDDEEPEPDMDYITALQYGLPPCAGWGMGIDRLVMLHANTQNIKEVMAFPLMKPV